MDKKLLVATLCEYAPIEVLADFIKKQSAENNDDNGEEEND